MISLEQKNLIINSMIELLDLPDSAYETAKNRYEDLGRWLSRSDSIIKQYNPHVFAQGSFRLGTAIRPLSGKEEYDLDLACKLRLGITKYIHSQEYLKNIIGQELEAYRNFRALKNPLNSKHRCWRLEYQDSLSFHMDIVPCIPEDESRQKILSESIVKSGLEYIIANSVSKNTISITDDRHMNFKTICDDWNISNPEGYSQWFEYRMNPTQILTLLKEAKVDTVPLFKKKLPLQRVIQLLKRHRDFWSRDNTDIKPISIIITTLAARAYNGETYIISALENILQKMEGFINPTKPKVPNPVDPEEDFADRWYRKDCLHLSLEDNFRAWLLQVKKDFRHITNTNDIDFISDQIEKKFSLHINKLDLNKKLGLNKSSVNVITPKTQAIRQQDLAKPWQI